MRGTNPGANDWDGGSTVLSPDSGFPAGENWEPGNRFQIDGHPEARKDENINPQRNPPDLLPLPNTRYWDPQNRGQ